MIQNGEDWAAVFLVKLSQQRMATENGAVFRLQTEENMGCTLKYLLGAKVAGFVLSRALWQFPAIDTRRQVSISDRKKKN